MRLKDLAAVFALATAATAVPAQAAYIMDIVEVGSDNVMTGPGTIDLALWSQGRFFTVQSAGDAGGLSAVGGEIVTVNVGNARLDCSERDRCALARSYFSCFLSKAGTFRQLEETPICYDSVQPDCSVKTRGGRCR